LFLSLFKVSANQPSSIGIFLTNKWQIEMKLNSQISAVITGGASGLGEATSRRLAKAGVKVSVFDLNADKGQALAKEIGAYFYHVNLTNEDETCNAFEQARKINGQERILVNCAGTANADKTVSRAKKTGESQRFPTSGFEKIIQVNLIATFRCISISAAGMMSLEPTKEGDRGVIVNTASIAAQDGQMGQAAYSASKAGIVGMTLPIARDFMNENIRINTILPGLFNTPLLQSGPPHLVEALAAAVPFPKRLGDPEEFAQLAEFMITNGYLNGECIRIDGSLRLNAR
jgi:NAD(P)-dependent dehydrogenase (short-subunit alcohol dehydrogenase family)